MGLFIAPAPVSSPTTPMAGAGIFGSRSAPIFGASVPAPTFGLGASTGVQQGILNYGQSDLGQYQLARQQQLMVDAGFPADTDPGELETPEAQRSANEAALAKLATFNPELAQELSSRMQGEPQDESFFDQMKGLAGDIFAPALAVGGKLIDLISRPAQIIPELIVDKEDDPWYEDIGQALSGNSTARGADVLEKWGVENGWAKGIGGFVFDVAADPLTYLTFGMGGLGRAAVTEGTTRLIGENVIRQGLKGTAGLTDDAIEGLAREVGQRLTNSAAVSADALPGLVAEGLSNVPMSLIDEAVARASAAGNALLRGQRLKSVADPRDVALLQEAVRAGGPGARQAAAALGGMRFRGGIPFAKSTRWTTAAIPMTDRVGLRTFGNFFRGTSGLTRLQKAVSGMPSERLAELGVKSADDVVRAFLSDGFRGMEKNFPKLTQELGGGPLNMGSMFMEASHQFGKVTGYLSPHANTLRHEGIAGIAATNAARVAKSLSEKVYEDGLTLWKDDFGGRTSGIELHRADVEKKLRALRNPSKWDDAIRWLENVPSRAAIEGDEVALKASLLESAERKYDHAIDAAGTDPAKRALAEDEWVRANQGVDERIQLMKRTHAALDDETKEAVELYRRLLRQIMVDGDKRGVSVLDRTVSHDFADRLNDTDMREWGHFGRTDVFEAETVMAFDGPAIRDEHLVAGKYDGVTLYRGTSKDYKGPPITSEDAEWNGALFGSTDSTTALMYGDNVEAIRLKPNAKVKTVTLSEGVNAVDELKLAKKEGFDAISFDEPTGQYGTAVLNKEAINTSRAGRGHGYRFDVRPKSIVQRLRRDGGFTVDANGKTPDRGYAVGGMQGGDQATIPASASDEEVEAFIESFRKQHADVLARPGHHLGGWEYEGKFYLDVSEIHADEAGAIAATSARGEIDYFDLSTLPTRVGVRIQRPLIDGPGASSDRNIIEEVFTTARKNLDDNKELHVKNNPELGLDDPAAWEEYADRMTDVLATAQFKQMGKDGIVHYDEAGEVVGGTVFPHEKVRNVKVWDDRVGGVASGDQGYFPHMFSDQFTEAERGLHRHEFRGSAEFVHERARTSKKDWHTLNDDLRTEKGMDIDALMRNPLEVLDRYARRYGNEAAELHLGAAGKSLSNVYQRVGMSVSLNTYRAQKGFVPRASLERLTAAEMKAHNKIAFRTERMLAEQEKAAQRVVAEKAALERQLILNEGRTRLASSSRLATGAVREEGRQIGAELRDALATRAKLKRLANTKPGDPTALNEAIRTNEAKINSLMAQRKDLASGKFSASTPERVMEQRAKLADQVEKARGKIERRATKAERTIARHRRNVETAMNELNKVRTRMLTEQAKSVPAMVPTNANLQGYVKVGVKELEDFAFHPHIAAEFNNALPNGDIGDLRKFFRRWAQGPWKKWATIYFPGFHLRNNMGATFNNWLGGVTVEDYVDSFRISRALGGAAKYNGVAIPKAKLRQWGLDNMDGITWDELGDLMHTHGVRATNSQGFADTGMSIREWRKVQEGKPSAAGKASEFLGDKVPYARAARAATEVTENFHRQAAFLQGLAQSRGSATGARMFTMLRHGDYEDLNDFEQGIKDLIPFYKWMRTNLPYQIHNLMEGPGKQLAALKFGNATYEVRGMDPDKEKALQPQWLREAFTIPLGAKGDDGVTMLSLDLPMADLYQGANDYLSAFLPMVRPFIESEVLGQNIFTGAPIEGKKLPLAGWAKLPGIRQVLDPFIDTDANGNEVMDDRIANMMSAIPVFSRFRNWVFADEKAQSGRASALASAVLGVRFRNVGDTELRAHELAFYYEQILPLTNQLREMGVTLPEPDQISPAVYSYLGFTPPAEGE
jgi:hypothetical protein